MLLQSLFLGPLTEIPWKLSVYINLYIHMPTNMPKGEALCQHRAKPELLPIFWTVRYYHMGQSSLLPFLICSFLAHQWEIWFLSSHLPFIYLIVHFQLPWMVVSDLLTHTWEIILSARISLNGWSFCLYSSKLHLFLRSATSVKLFYTSVIHCIILHYTLWCWGLPKWC